MRDLIMGLRTISILLVVAGLLVTVTATIGCGGDSSSASDTNAAAEATGASNGGAGSDEAAEEFAVSRKGREGVEFGSEASEGEREAASLVLEENLKARASHDWTTQCATLSSKGVESIERKGQACAQVLRAESVAVSKSVLENTLEDEIDALRVRGAQAFALWHGTGGGDYAMAMENENGQWKVASLTTTRLPQAPKVGSKSKSSPGN